MDYELLRILGIPTIILSIGGAIGAYYRQVLKERASRVEADSAQLREDRAALKTQLAERIAEAKAREDALRLELKAEREAHIATARNLGVALDALGDEMRERDAAQARMLVEQSQKVLDAIKDRKASLAAVRAAREVARLSSPGEPLGSAEVSAEPEQEEQRHHRHQRAARDADASARRRPLPPLTEEEAGHVLDTRRR